MNDYKSIWQKYTKNKNEFTIEEYESLQLEIAYLKKQLSTQSKLVTQLKQDAYQDSLTKVWNRRKFQEDLEKSLEFNHRYKRTSGVLFIDLNHFKAINDSLGHLAGDAVLQHISKVLVNNCRTNDEVYRLGGDEFVIIMPEATEEVASAKSNQLTNIIANSKCRFKDNDICLSASIGACSINHLSKKDDVLENADKQMYKIKQEFHSLQLVS